MTQRPRKKKRRKPFSKERILNVAEIEFADRGYKGTSTRDIAAAAKVNLALINYYFGSKTKLYYAIFNRRGQELSRQRSLLLDELEKRSRPPSVEDLIRSFLFPAISMKHQGPHAMAFLRLQARLQSEPKEITERLRKAVYNETTIRYIKAFKRALPHIKPSVIYWRMTMMIGAYLYLVSDANRLEHLSNGLCDAQDEREVLKQLVAFLVGGFESQLAG